MRKTGFRKKDCFDQAAMNLISIPRRASQHIWEGSSWYCKIKLVSVHLPLLYYVLLCYVDLVAFSTFSVWRFILALRKQLAPPITILPIK
ncbi:hypothetical protein NC651_013722 [Populus alba x Populus x berolinensis]|nr:hypothetical protein NC651_013722 [Populus alba x Populus x berolinensis]